MLKGKDKHIVFAFGRLNPPTAGHSKLIDKVHSEAKKLGADHRVIVSHSFDAKKNPLQAHQKISYLKSIHRGAKFEASSPQHPHFLAHLKKMHQEGHTHVTMVAGSDRVNEFQRLVDKYNGPNGDYHFKHIKVVSAGQRDPDAEGVTGISGTKMRAHASNNDYKSFKSGLHMRASDTHAKKLFQATRAGMGLKEEDTFKSFGLYLKENINVDTIS
jgi:nicotinic acid mononucleotide adenylyltransferase